MGIQYVPIAEKCFFKFSAENGENPKKLKGSYSFEYHTISATKRQKDCLPLLLLFCASSQAQNALY